MTLFSESGVREDDVGTLRKMCADLVGDVLEMMKNADALGSVLGPDAKQFVESLRAILGEVKKSSRCSPRQSLWMIRQRQQRQKRK